MDVKTIVCLFLFQTFCVKSLKSLPSFGDEFVHIKVHVPKEVASTRGILHSTYPGSPQYPHTSHKVIHHYHRHRKHFKRQKAPALESLLLEELDQASEEEEPANEETFVVKEVPTEQKVNTYQVIEETVQKPPPPHREREAHVDTIQIIENKEHKKLSHDHEDASHLDSVKIVEETKNFHQDENKDDYVSTPHLKTVEVVAETKNYAPKPYDVDHDHAEGYTKQRPRKESLKIIETSFQQHDDDHKSHHSQHEHHYHAHDSDESEHHHHHHYKTPHVETVEIIKAKKSPVYYEKEYHDEKYFEDDHSGEYHPHGYHKETVEVIQQAKASPKHHHPWEYKERDHHSLTHQQKEIIEVEEQVSYTKPRKEYDYHRAGTYSGHKPKIIIEDHIDYDRPSISYRDRHQTYEKPIAVYREEHREKIVRPTRLGHYAYDPEADVESDHYYRPHYSDHRVQSHAIETYPVRSTKQYHYPRPPDKDHSYRVVEREETNYDDCDQTKYHSEYAPESYASPSDSVATFIAKPPISNTKYTKSRPQTASSSFIPHVDNFNAKHPSITGEKSTLTHSHIDWPKGLEKTHTDDTYSGYDSYSAIHVQGVGSGGYHYPPN